MDLSRHWAEFVSFNVKRAILAMISAEFRKMFSLRMLKSNMNGDQITKTELF